MGLRRTLIFDSFVERLKVATEEAVRFSRSPGRPKLDVGIVWVNTWNLRDLGHRSAAPSNLALVVRADNFRWISILRSRTYALNCSKSLSSAGVIISRVDSNDMPGPSRLSPISIKGVSIMRDELFVEETSLRLR